MVQLGTRFRFWCVPTGPPGVVVPGRTLRRFAAELCGPRRGRATTVRVADGEPGAEVQVDFGRMGLLFDAGTGRRWVCHAFDLHRLLLAALLRMAEFSQTTAAVIDGCEAAWQFFGGVFRVVIPEYVPRDIEPPRDRWRLRLQHRRRACSNA